MFACGRATRAFRFYVIIKSEFSLWTKMYQATVTPSICHTFRRIREAFFFLSVLSNRLFKFTAHVGIVCACILSICVAREISLTCTHAHICICFTAYGGYDIRINERRSKVNESECVCVNLMTMYLKARNRK